MTIRFGVVGAGTMGEMHCRVARQVRGLELVGVYDTDHERAERVARNHGTNAAASLEALFDSVDAIVVSTPTSTHPELAIPALARGLHVLVEKPVAATVEDARAIASAVRPGTVCAAGHIERHNATFQELCTLIGDQRPLAVSLRRLNFFAPRITDADVTLDLLIHDVDLLVTLVGSMPQSIQATGMRVVTAQLDHVDALFAFRDGSTGAITASRITENKVRRIEVIATGRYVVADLFHRTLTVHRRAESAWMVSGPDLKVRIDSVTEQVQVPIIEPLFAELTDFAAAIHERRPPLVPIDQGVRALELVLQVRGAVDDRGGATRGAAVGPRAR